MRALTLKETAAWCDERGILIDANGTPGYGSEPLRQFDIKLPTISAGLIYVARMLTRLETRGFHASAQKSSGEFCGCLLLIKDCKTWSTLSQDIGLYILGRLCFTDPDTPKALNIEHTPALVFDASEVTLATTAVLQALLFQWDAYLITESGNYIAHISREGAIKGIIARIPSMLDLVRPLFIDFGIREAIPFRRFVKPEK